MTAPAGVPRQRAQDDAEASAHAGPANVEVANQVDVDQLAAGIDQTAADADQTASDADQTRSDRDQAQGEADQRASDRDQAAADRDHARRTTTIAQNGVYEATRVERLEGTLEREETARGRELTATTRATHATRRDENARQRDLGAQARDIAAEERDHVATALEDQLEQLPSSARDARSYVANVRARAASDRARAAGDRALAASDRATAARDREYARAELRRAQHDQLTGAFGRELGMVALGHEIDRARRRDELLVFAFVDVDGLKAINDRDGHAAGDALLREVVQVMRAQLRSYDPIVRIGGDEFVCALSDTTLDDARVRFQHIREAIEARHHSASISVGFAALAAGDSLASLIARGDKDLYEAKLARPLR